MLRSLRETRNFERVHESPERAKEIRAEKKLTHGHTILKRMKRGWVDLLRDFFLHTIYGQHMQINHYFCSAAF